MKSTISIQAQAHSFQSAVNWKAVARVALRLGIKVWKIVSSEMFALKVNVAACVVMFFSVEFFPTVFLISTAVATVAMMRWLIPMAKGGEQ